MAEQNKATEDQLSEDQLSEVAGGANAVNAARIEHLENQTKSVDNIQETVLENRDSRDSSK